MLKISKFNNKINYGFSLYSTTLTKIKKPQTYLNLVDRKTIERISPQPQKSIFSFFFFPPPRETPRKKKESECGLSGSHAKQFSFKDWQGFSAPWPRYPFQYLTGLEVVVLKGRRYVFLLFGYEIFFVVGGRMDWSRKCFLTSRVQGLFLKIVSLKDWEDARLLCVSLLVFITLDFSFI